MGNDARGRLEESDLSVPASDQSRERLTSSFDPLGKLLRDDSGGVLTGIQSADQGRGASVPASNIERPRHKGTVLIRIQANAVRNVASDAVLEGW